MRNLPAIVPVGAASTRSLVVIASVASVGSSLGRTLALASYFSRYRRGTTADDRAGLSALSFGAAAIIALLIARLLGLNELPRWTDVAVVIVAVQTGFSVLMGVALTRMLGPMDPASRGATHEHFSFMLYGVVVWPALALFLVSMTVISIVQ